MKKLFVLGVGVTLIFTLIFPVGLIKAGDELITESQTRSAATNLGLFGSTTWDMAVDPNSDYIYIATMYTPNGFFRSADNGLTWSGLPKDVDYGSGQAVAVNPTNGHVYALLQSLIVSTDNGETFSKIDNSNGSSLLYAHDRLFLGMGDGTIKISTNEGASSTTVTIESGVVVRSLAASSSAIFALTRNYDTNTYKLYKSADHGATWMDLNIAASGITEAEKVIVSPNTGHVFLLPTSSSSAGTYRSNDSGATWTALSSDTPKGGHASFDSVNRMYMGWKYSDNEGSTWTTYRDRGDYAHFVYVDSDSDNILYDTTTPGFAISTDRGATWTDHVEGITGVIVTGVSQAKNKNIIWTATQNGLAKTTNFLSGEPDWQYPILPTAYENFTSSGKDSVWVNPDNTNIVVVGTSAAINYSTDAGATWSSATTAIDMTGRVTLQIVNDKDGVLYAAVGPTTPDTSGGGVLKSEDNGVTWTSLSFPSDAATQSIAVAKNGDLYVGAGVKSHQVATSESIKGLYKYNKSENSWSKLDAPSYKYPSVIVDPETEDTIYALAATWSSNKKAGFYKSTDAGKTWKQSSEGLSDLIDFTAMTVQKSTSPNTLYLAAVNEKYKGLIFKSSDMGETWGLLYTGLIDESFNVLLFDGLLGGNERGLYSLKSKAKIKVVPSKKMLKKGTKVLFSVNLKDAATKKKLKRRIVALYRKAGKKWIQVEAKRTNKNAKAVLSAKVKKNTTFQVRFQPQKKYDRVEYALSKSRKIKIKVSK